MFFNTLKGGCATNSCLNNGVCILNGDGSTSCLCPVTYTGSLCDTQSKINEFFFKICKICKWLSKFRMVVGFLTPIFAVKVLKK